MSIKTINVPKEHHDYLHNISERLLDYQSAMDVYANKQRKAQKELWEFIGDSCDVDTDKFECTINMNTMVVTVLKKR